MAPRTKKKPAKRKNKVRGFLIAHAFTSYGFSTRVTPPYFETDNGDLAAAIALAKGVQELTPKAMEEYKAHRRAFSPGQVAKELRAAADKDAHELAAQREAAKHAEAEANTKAEAAAQRVAELGADDGDLFADPEAEAGGLTAEDLGEMTDAELLGVLEQFGIAPPKKGGRAVILPIALQAIAGKVKAPAESEG